MLKLYNVLANQHENIFVLGRNIPYKNRSSSEDSRWIKTLAGRWLGYDHTTETGEEEWVEVSCCFSAHRDSIINLFMVCYIHDWNYANQCVLMEKK